MKSVFLTIYSVSALVVPLKDTSDNAVFTYTSTEKCAACIAGGYKYCVQGFDNQTISPIGLDPSSVCCQATGCSQESNVGFSCSSTFTSPSYALGACPHKQSKCGSKNYFQYNRENEQSSTTSINLLKGESCTYRVEANCGAPGFMLEDGSTADTNYVGISYTEWNNN